MLFQVCSESGQRLWGVNGLGCKKTCPATLYCVMSHYSCCQLIAWRPRPYIRCQNPCLFLSLIGVLLQTLDTDHHQLYVWVDRELCTSVWQWHVPLCQSGGRWSRDHNLWFYMLCGYLGLNHAITSNSRPKSLPKCY